MQQFDQSLRCPITLTLFRDPVVCESGHTYSRHAIEAHWNTQLRQGQPATDPLSNLPLGHRTTITNWIVRQQVDDFLERQGPDYLPDGWPDRNVPAPSDQPRIDQPGRNHPPRMWRNHIMVHCIAIAYCIAVTTIHSRGYRHGLEAMERDKQREAALGAREARNEEREKQLLETKQALEQATERCNQQHFTVEELSEALDSSQKQLAQSELRLTDAQRRCFQPVAALRELDEEIQKMRAELEESKAVERARKELQSRYSEQLLQSVLAA